MTVVESGGVGGGVGLGGRLTVGGRRRAARAEVGARVGGAATRAFVVADDGGGGRLDRAARRARTAAIGGALRAARAVRCSARGDEDERERGSRLRVGGEAEAALEALGLDARGELAAPSAPRACGSTGRTGRADARPAAERVRRRRRVDAARAARRGRGARRPASSSPSTARRTASRSCGAAARRGDVRRRAVRSRRQRCRGSTRRLDLADPAARALVGRACSRGDARALAGALVVAARRRRADRRPALRDDRDERSARRARRSARASRRRAHEIVAARPFVRGSSRPSGRDPGGVWTRRLDCELRRDSARLRLPQPRPSARGGGPSVMRTCVRMPYVELHAHSAFSFLDGTSLPAELAEAAAAARLRGVRADRPQRRLRVDGVRAGGEGARAEGDPRGGGRRGRRAVDAAGGPLARRPTCAAIPRRRRRATSRCSSATRRGWANLCRLLTKAHAHTRAPDGRAGRRRAARDARRRRGARRGARLPQRLLAPTASATSRRCAGCSPPSAATRSASSCSGRSSATTARSTAAWPSLAERLGVPCVATGNVHAHTRERARLQDAFVAIREHTTLDASEPLRRGNHAHVLASPQAMAARFADHPEAVAETARLADTLALRPPAGPRLPLPRRRGRRRRPPARRDRARARFDDRYPHGNRHRARGRASAWRPSCGSSPASACRASSTSTTSCSSSRARWRARCAGRAPRARCCRRAAAAGRACRRSSATSPASRTSTRSKNELLLGRFLNEEITSLPDIDLDFPRDVREVLLPRVHERYGRERSALVAAFPTYKPRGAIRELGKALGLPPGEIERVARGSEAWGQRRRRATSRSRWARSARTDGRWAWLDRAGRRGVRACRATSASTRAG